MEEQLVKKKITGYKRKMSREQIVDAAQKAKDGAFLPEIARFYGITFGECLGLLMDEQVGKENIRYKKYGTKKLKLQSDPKIKNIIERMYREGKDDDQIAQELGSCVPSVARARSHYGYVAFTRAVGNGHHSKHEYKHTVLIGPPIGTIVGIQETKDGYAAQGRLFDHIDLETSLLSELTELNENKIERTIVCNPGDTRVYSEKPNEHARIIYEDGLIKVVVINNSTAIEKDQISLAIKRLVKMITWREIAYRIQSPSTYYIVEFGLETLVYFKQVNVDLLHNIVDVEYIRTERKQLSNN